MYFAMERPAGSIKEADCACTQTPDQPMAKAARIKPPMPPVCAASEAPVVTSSTQLKGANSSLNQAAKRSSETIFRKTEKKTTNPHTASTELTASLTAAAKSSR